MYEFRSVANFLVQVVIPPKLMIDVNASFGFERRIFTTVLLKTQLTNYTQYQIISASARTQYFCLIKLIPFERRVRNGGKCYIPSGQVLFLRPSTRHVYLSQPCVAYLQCGEHYSPKIVKNAVLHHKTQN